MKSSLRNLLPNLVAIGALALFLSWAETNLDGYKVQILNLIAVNAILALSLNLIYGFTGMSSRADSSPPSSGCSSPSRCCGSGATTSASPRWASRKSSASSS